MNIQIARTIGTVAREARKREALTQAEVAELLEIATEVYGRMERGHLLPSIETFRKLCTVLGVPPHELLGLPVAALSQGALAPPASARASRPEVRRLLQKVEALATRHVRLLSMLASALGRERGL
jgi:transcriptional regulator with XRE-family HTH domain